MTEIAVREIDSLADFAMREPRSLWGDAWRRLISLNTARMGMVIVSILFLVSVLAPIVYEYDPKIDSNLRERLNPPSRVATLPIFATVKRWCALENPNMTSSRKSADPFTWKERS